MDYNISYESTFKEFLNEPMINKIGWFYQKLKEKT